MKAFAFARTFVSKSALLEEIVDTAFFVVPDAEFGDLAIFRPRACRRLFKKLDASKATGHDKISAQILNCLTDCLAVPFTRLCRSLFYEDCWSSACKYHLIVSIFKMGAAFMP